MSRLRFVCNVYPLNYAFCIMNCDCTRFSLFFRLVLYGRCCWPSPKIVISKKMQDIQHTTFYPRPTMQFHCPYKQPPSPPHHTLLPQHHNHQQKKPPPYILRYIIDIDGFIVNGQFLGKELAICDMTTSLITLYRFKVGSFRKLSLKNRQQVTWVRNNVHGLDFFDLSTDLAQNKMLSIIRKLCIHADKNYELIGYKGGNFEFDLIRSFGFQHLAYNIELLGCPRLEVLIGSFPPPSDNFMSSNAGCPHHRPINGNRTPHCPKLEVAYFRNYLYSFKQHVIVNY